VFDKLFARLPGEIHKIHFQECVHLDCPDWEKLLRSRLERFPANNEKCDAIWRCKLNWICIQCARSCVHNSMQWISGVFGLELLPCLLRPCLELDCAHRHWNAPRTHYWHSFHECFQFFKRHHSLELLGRRRAKETRWNETSYHESIHRRSRVEKMKD